MLEKKTENRDYTERFEFRVVVGDNIICQRYFKINNFNPNCLCSYELQSTIRECAKMIDDDLKSKTIDYLQIFAPMYFESMEEAEEWVSKPWNLNRIGVGHGLVIKGDETNYFWDGKSIKACSFKYDDGDLCNGFNMKTNQYGQTTYDDENVVTYKFMFLIDGKEVISSCWDGIYPKYIRNSIDLSNKRGGFSDDEDVYSLNFERYLIYKIYYGRKDLIYPIIKKICSECSHREKDYYTISSSGIGLYKADGSEYENDFYSFVKLEENDTEYPDRVFVKTGFRDWADGNQIRLTGSEVTF